MAYFVNRTYSGLTIHDGTCHDDVEDRHGPFESRREAVSAARALAFREISDCNQCGGAGRNIVGCHCERCVSVRRNP